MADQETLLKGMVIGMEMMGANYVKDDGTHMYFEIIKGSKMDNDEKLKLAQEAIYKLTGFGIKVKRVNAFSDDSSI